MNIREQFHRQVEAGRADMDAFYKERGAVNHVNHGGVRRYLACVLFHRRYWVKANRTIYSYSIWQHYNCTKCKCTGQHTKVTWVLPWR